MLRSLGSIGIVTGLFSPLFFGWELVDLGWFAGGIFLRATAMLLAVNFRVVQREQVQFQAELANPGMESGAVTFPARLSCYSNDYEFYADIGFAALENGRISFTSERLRYTVPATKDRLGLQGFGGLIEIRYPGSTLKVRLRPLTVEPKEAGKLTSDWFEGLTSNEVDPAEDMLPPMPSPRALGVRESVFAVAIVLLTVMVVIGELEHLSAGIGLLAGLVAFSVYRMVRAQLDYRKRFAKGIEGFFEEKLEEG